jgi:hypothetical protein
MTTFGPKRIEETFAGLADAQPDIEADLAGDSR